MRLAIDCRALRKTPSGIPNFLVSAINEIAFYKPDWEIYLLSNDKFNEELISQINLKPNIKLIIQPAIILNKFSFIWLLSKVNSLLKEIKPDLYWGPAFILPPFLPKEIRTLVTVHDMVYKEQKGTMSRFNKLIFDLLHDFSVNKAERLWANSLYTKNAIEKYFPGRKCINIFTGFFINNFNVKLIKLDKEDKLKLLNKLKIREKFLLFVGTLEPRKNLSFLLSLMPELALQGYDLLIVGAKGWGKINIKNIVESKGFPRDNVIFSGFITTQELVLLYNIASVYVSTSKYEGFGMPQLEAMACGCPVVSPHNSAMIEVVDGAGETVKSWNANDWINTINMVYNNREKYILAGLNRVKKYEREDIIKDLTIYMETDY
jgi:glycosyltransferase involved in cell wall biosynthesis